MPQPFDSQVRRSGPGFQLIVAWLGFASLTCACIDDDWGWEHGDPIPESERAGAGAGASGSGGRGGAGVDDDAGLPESGGSGGVGGLQGAGSGGRAGSLAAGSGGHSAAAGAGGAAGSSAPIDQRAYLYMRRDGAGVTHVTLSHTPDASLDKTHDITGDVRIFSGSLFALSANVLTKYEVDNDLELVNKGQLDFRSYPLTHPIAFFDMTQIGAHSVYIQTNTVGRIVWDPIDGVIRSVSDTSMLPRTLEELPLHAAGNANQVAFDERGWLLYNYTDTDGFKYGSKSYLASYDASTQQETLTEIPCPGIDTASVDEQGRTYVSSAAYSGLLTLYGLGPKSCVARLRADGTLDETWTTDLLDVTDGHYPVMLQYGRDGWALMNVLYHEDLGANFSDTTIPPAVLIELWRPVHWKVWRVDLGTRTGQPLTELTGRLDPGALSWRDGRVYVRSPADAVSGTSKLYELGKSGTLSLVDESSGAGKWIRLR